MFAATFILLYVAHLVSDYALQTDHQAKSKALRGRAGWIANLAHAATHVAVTGIVLTIGFAILQQRMPLLATVAAVVWIGATHAVIDRRWPIAWWMDNTGSADFRASGGAAHVDQTAHVLALAIAAMVIVA